MLLHNQNQNGVQEGITSVAPDGEAQNSSTGSPASTSPRKDSSSDSTMPSSPLRAHVRAHLPNNQVTTVSLMLNGILFIYMIFIRILILTVFRADLCSYKRRWSFIFFRVLFFYVLFLFFFEDQMQDWADCTWSISKGNADTRLNTWNLRRLYMFYEVKIISHFLCIDGCLFSSK